MLGENTKMKSLKVRPATKKRNAFQPPKTTTVTRTNNALAKSDASPTQLTSTTSRMATIASSTKSDLSLTQPVTTALHMKFDFTLYKGGEQRPPSRQEAHALMTAFPNCHTVELSPPYLVLRF